jgi:DNA-binding MarR family transcriptional regulator
MSTREEVHDAFSLMESTVFTLLTAGAEFWARVDLTMPQLKVLLLLGRHGSAPVSWLASRMDVSPPNITGILDRLEQRGWVRRMSDPRDRRVVRIVLTEDGEQLLHQLSGAGIDNLRESLRTLNNGAADDLRRGLARFLSLACESEAAVEHAPAEHRRASA